MQFFFFYKIYRYYYLIKHSDIIDGEIIGIAEKKDFDNAIYYSPIIEYPYLFNNYLTILTFTSKKRLLGNEY